MSHGISQIENRDWNFKNNVTIRGDLRRTPSRVYLEEFFLQRPGLNADIDQVYTIEVARAVNKNWEVLGTNATTALTTFSATEAGIVMTTAGADNDQAILTPHLDTAVTAWGGYLWGTENEVKFETTIRTGAAIATELIWVGLKLTNTPTIATDDNQVIFRYSTVDADTNWKITYSVSGTDVSVDTGVAVAVSTIYNFRIEIDEDRKARFYINDKHVATSTALTNDVDLIPYVAIQALAVAAVNMTVFNVKASRKQFE